MKFCGAYVCLLVIFFLIILILDLGVSIFLVCHNTVFVILDYERECNCLYFAVRE